VVRDARPPIVVLSPHLDDAVLSAWHAVAAGGTTVVTFFAGVPPDGFVTDLDRSHGAEDSAAWLRRRRSEDRAALAAGGARAVHLDLLEAQFPAYRRPDLRRAIAARPDRFLALVVAAPELATDSEALVSLAEPHLPAGAVVYGPVGVGGHPDHRDLARATVRLAGRVGKLRLYADSPYYLLQGRPSWLGRSGNPAADRAIESALAGSGADRLRLRRQVVPLPAEQSAVKLAAIRRYTTELPGIEAALAGAGGELELMRHEVYWSVG
jgi:LmbE family N-acetylglucosaminyl deacetylase